MAKKTQNNEKKGSQKQKQDQQPVTATPRFSRETEKGRDHGASGLGFRPLPGNYRKGFFPASRHSKQSLHKMVQTGKGHAGTS